LPDAVYKIGRDEGIAALFRGSLTRMIFHIPMTVISMTVLEMTKPSLVSLLERR
jgi:hypothetical protein